MKKRLILVGKAASGKDHARRLSQRFGLSYAVSYTTRPPRKGELNGIDYLFVSTDAFEKMITENLMYEHVVFNDWHYGTSIKQMETDTLFIMTPKGLSHLSPLDREESHVIYFDIPEGIRRDRMEKRIGNADSVDRRIEADEIDFENFTNFDDAITESNYTWQDINPIIIKNIDLENENILSNRRTISRRDYINNK
jgi:guanylate kinase